MGTFVAFATAPCSVAEDGWGDNSPFTDALAEYVDRPFDSISGMMVEVRRRVFEKTHHRQVPWEYSWLFEQFTFCGEPKGRIITPEEREIRDWELVADSRNPDLLRGFLRQYPKTKFRQATVDRLEALLWRHWTVRLLTGAGVLLISALLLFWVYVGHKWLTFYKIENHDLPGGDIYFDLPSKLTAGEKGTLAQCFWRCLVNFNCKGFNHETELSTQRQTCYLKDEILYKLPNQHPEHSKLVSYASSRYAAPKNAGERFYFLWDNFLEGTHIPPRSVRPNQKDEKYLSVGSKLDCLSTCDRLGPRCEGFNFVAIAGVANCLIMCTSPPDCRQENVKITGRVQRRPVECQGAAAQGAFLQTMSKRTPLSKIG